MGLARVSLESVKKAWRGTASERGYNFGFNLKTLLGNERGHSSWFDMARRLPLKSRPGLSVIAYLPAAYQYVSREVMAGDNITVGAQEVSWAKPGSHTAANHAESVLADFPRIDAALVNHSEVIAEQGRTLEQAARQVRMLLDTTVEGRTFKFITICVGEDRATYDKISARGERTAAVRYVKNQVRTILGLAKVTAEETARIGIAYEPRFAIQVGDTPGIPPENAHIKKMGWAILQAAAEVVGLQGGARMFALQYGGSMKAPGDAQAPVERFVGPGNAIDADLYNGGLIGTAGKVVETAAAIVNKLVPVNS